MNKNDQLRLKSKLDAYFEIEVQPNTYGINIPVVQFYSEGLLSEVGEIFDLLKRTRVKNHRKPAPTKEQFIEEVGDMLWYLAGWVNCGGLKGIYNTPATFYAKDLAIVLKEVLYATHWEGTKNYDAILQFVDLCLLENRKKLIARRETAAKTGKVDIPRP